MTLKFYISMANRKNLGANSNIFLTYSEYGYEDCLSSIEIIYHLLLPPCENCEIFFFHTRIAQWKFAFVVVLSFVFEIDFLGILRMAWQFEIKCGSIKFHKQGKQLSAPGYYLSKFSGHRYHQIRRNSEIKKVFSSSTKWPLTRIKPLSTNINIQQTEGMDNLDYNRLKKWMILVCYIVTKIIKFFLLNFI